jgi:MYXO-CTERM domain-containing protein
MLPMKSLSKVGLFFGIVLLSFTPMKAQTGQLTLPVGNTDSWDGIGSASNVSFGIDLHTLDPLIDPTQPVLITGLGWEVTLSSIAPSWLSELGVSFGSSSGSGSFTLRPAAGDEFQGTSALYSSPNLVLADLSIANVVVLPGGQLIVEFFESFDDAAGAVDGIWESGTITLDYSYTVIPEAGQSGLLAAVAVGLFCFLRRRRS